MERSFNEVFKKIVRMCSSTGCLSCPLYSNGDGCTARPNALYPNPTKIEQVVTDWTDEHPEKNEWTNNISTVSMKSGVVVRR